MIPALRRIARAVSLTVAVGLAGCPKESSVWIVAGSTTARLEFGVSKHRGDTQGIHFNWLVVFTCESMRPGPVGTAWLLVPEDASSAPKPNRVIYGQPPPGWQSSAGPAILTTGCYYVRVDGTGLAKFRVHDDGSVEELSLTYVDPH